jgi:hypothetical protein
MPGSHQNVMAIQENVKFNLGPVSQNISGLRAVSEHMNLLRIRLVEHLPFYVR